MKKNKNSIIAVFVFVAFIFVIGINAQKDIEKAVKETAPSSSRNFRIISSTENKDLEDVIRNYARKNFINIDIEYAGTIDIMDRLNNGEEYDAVWTSNSIWLYMLNNNIKLKNSKSTSINPVVFGIKKSKAKELGFIDKEIYTKDILSAIKSNKLKFSMSSATQTNTGATAYLGFVSTLAGNPEILKEEDLKSEELKQNLKELFSGVTRSSGSDEFLEEMFLKGDYEAVVTYETSIININKKLEQEGKEPLYIVYAKDGVSISDSPFAYIDNSDDSKLEKFTKLQSYILSNEGQQELVKTGRRVWYGGTNANADKTVFNPNWGIDTTKYLVPIKYPSTAVIKTALGVYQTELRKPIHAVFCLDYSGSMYGTGNKQLVEAMDYILDKDKASKNLLQFSEKDKISVVPFSGSILAKWHTDNGTQTSKMIQDIKNLQPSGQTDIYLASQTGLEILKNEDTNKYNTSIILMTDGASNSGSLKQLQSVYQSIGKDIPIYSIMFGSASSNQLDGIAQLTNAKVFDGRTNLLEAFKQVRGYN